MVARTWRQAALVAALSHPLVAQRPAPPPPPVKRLIVHADDLGMSVSIDKAAMAAVEAGTVSSVSVMVPAPAFDDAVERIKAHPSLDVGVHLTLTSEWLGVRWRPILPVQMVPSLVDEQGFFHRTWDATKANPLEVEQELRAQILTARQAGLQLTHLDVHQNVLFTSGHTFAEVLANVATDEGLPVLLAKSGLAGSAQVASFLPNPVILESVRTISAAESPGGWARWYDNTLRALPPGVNLLVVHPGYDDEEMRTMIVGQEAWGAAWRQRETDVLLSPEFRKQLSERGLILIGWRSVPPPRKK